MTFFRLLGKIDASYKRRILPLFGFRAQVRLLGLSIRADRRPPSGAASGVRRPAQNIF